MRESEGLSCGSVEVDAEGNSSLWQDLRDL